MGYSYTWVGHDYFPLKQTYAAMAYILVLIIYPTIAGSYLVHNMT